MKKRYLFTLLITLASCLVGYTQEQVLYKKVDTTQLYLTVYRSTLKEPNKKTPAIIFFFGGGWNNGTVKQFEPQAKYFIQRGVTCILADYRVKERQNATPFESLQDAKSAIRFIRAEANELNIDPTKIIASGGSAGGHLAAATACLLYTSPSPRDS